MTPVRPLIEERRESSSATVYKSNASRPSSRPGARRRLASSRPAGGRRLARRAGGQTAWMVVQHTPTPCSPRAPAASALHSRSTGIYVLVCLMSLVSDLQSPTWGCGGPHQLWVRGHRVRADPARAGSVFFWGARGALRCWPIESPSQFFLGKWCCFLPKTYVGSAQFLRWHL
jgi:hypothetical protein